MFNRLKTAQNAPAAQARLVELEARLAAVDRSQAVIEFSPTGIILDANANFLATMGYAAEDVIGRHHRMFVDPVEADGAAYRQFWLDLAAGRHMAAEYKRFAKGGREVWILGSYNPIAGPDGKVAKVIKYATDVTATKLINADYEGQIDAIGKSQAVIQFDLTGRILAANRPFLDTMGYEVHEVIGQHHSMFVEPSARESQDYKAFWDRLRQGEYTAAEFKRLGKGGREVWIQASYNPILDMNGKPFKVVKYATDVTCTKLQNADFSGQIDAIGKSQAVIEFDLEGNILWANDNFTSTVGYELAEIQGRHHSLFVDQTTVQSAEYARFWADLKAGHYRAGEFRRLGKDGREVWIQASYNPILDMNGKPFKIVKYATDITNAVQSREKFNLLSLVADETDNSVVITDRHRRIIFVNGGFERLTGFKASEVMGQNPGQLLQGPKTDRATIARIRDHLAKGQPFYEEILNYDRQKKPYWISLAINPVRNERGEVERFISIQANVTETKQRSLEFNTRLEAISQSNVMAEWSVAGQPLTGNAGSADHATIPLNRLLSPEQLAQLLRQNGLRTELEWPRQDAESLWLDASFSVLTNLEGEAEKLMMCGVDVTPRRRAIARSTETMSDMMAKITAVVESISGFARQTNLLALNAAIEAARAGDTGRGFALVAQEIRKLAVEASSSVKQIDGLLEESRQQIAALSGQSERLSDTDGVKEPTPAQRQRTPTTYVAEHRRAA